MVQVTPSRVEGEPLLQGPAERLARALRLGPEGKIALGPHDCFITHTRRVVRRGRRARGVRGTSVLVGF